MKMIMQQMQEWYYGREVRLDSDEPDTIGGLGVLHQTHLVRSRSAQCAQKLVAWLREVVPKMLNGAAIATAAAMATRLLKTCALT